MRTAGPAALLAEAREREPARPLLTWYDDATGERVELSATTLDNWVAKTANLLQDEFDIGPGSVVALALPAHWQSAAVLLGVWSCGATVLDSAVEDDGGLAGADLVLAAEDRLAAVEESETPVEVLGLSLHPLGAGMTDYVGEARDFALEVRTAGDRFSPWQALDPAAPGLVAGTLQLTLGGLVEASRDMARRLSLGPGDRILVEADTAAEVGPVGWLLAPLAAGASIVLVRHPDADRVPARAAAERVTATLGLAVEGIPALGDRVARP